MRGNTSIVYLFSNWIINVDKKCGECQKMFKIIQKLWTENEDIVQN